MTAPVFYTTFGTSAQPDADFNSTLTPSANQFFSTLSNSYTTPSFTVAYEGGIAPYSSAWTIARSVPSQTAGVGITLSDDDGLTTTVSFTTLPQGSSSYVLTNTGTDFTGATAVKSVSIIVYYDKDNGVFVPPNPGDIP